VKSAALRNDDLVDKAYKQVRQMILKSKLKPGQKLIQEDLASKLGISRTPLLSALSKLEKEMLIETKPRRGYFVKLLTPEEALQLYDIRVQLEPMGAVGAAQNRTAAQARSLEKLLERFHSSTGRQKFCELDYSFHCQIMSMSGNKMLYPILSSFYIVLFSNQMDLLDDARPFIGEHEEITRAIIDGDTDKAGIIMLDHIRRGRQQFIDKQERDRRSK